MLDDKKAKLQDGKCEKKKLDVILALLRGYLHFRANMVIQLQILYNLHDTKKTLMV